MRIKMKYQEIPIFINSRDLVTPLRRLVTWLLEAGYARIFILDNASTYPPLLEYYAAVDKDVTVLPLGANVGHKAIWDLDIVAGLGISTPYVYTDPDIVPLQECPSHVLEYFLEILRAFPKKTKVGFGLMISDLPDHYRWKQRVIVWESQFWEKRITPTLYDAAIDTTFALYRSGSGYDLSGIRTGFPYMARHTPWYTDTGQPSAEQLFYQQRAKPGTNHWSGADLPDWLEACTRRRMRLPA